MTGRSKYPGKYSSGTQHSAGEKLAVAGETARAILRCAAREWNWLVAAPAVRMLPEAQINQPTQLRSHAHRFCPRYKAFPSAARMHKISQLTRSIHYARLKIVKNSLLLSHGGWCAAAMAYWNLYRPHCVSCSHWARFFR